MPKNEGAKAADGEAVRLVVDNNTNEADEKPVDGLAAGASTDLAFGDVTLKKRKDHTLVATVDAKNSVVESKEGNNTLPALVRCKDEDN